MLEYLILPLVYNLFCASDAQIEFFREPFKGDSIKESPSQDRSISLGVPSDDPLI